ncbi:hypothetical protein GDO81_000778 [Engystomops pustulosus]|uniref:Secreted protein n=1 Tax=Engystomops pustulosus TaxID=76066 RepID=A0AAV7D7X5_ENGPU|nr:hypothetical protein GDO81_000778 [Engystomops pustulosus]
MMHNLYSMMSTCVYLCYIFKHTTVLYMFKVIKPILCDEVCGIFAVNDLFFPRHPLNCNSPTARFVMTVCQDNKKKPSHCSAVPILFCS